MSVVVDADPGDPGDLGGKMGWQRPDDGGCRYENGPRKAPGVAQERSWATGWHISHLDLGSLLKSILGVFRIGSDWTFPGGLRPGFGRALAGQGGG